MEKFKIVGISGSLRKKSFNTATLKVAQKLAPKDVEIEIIDISKLPFFNEDIEQNPPQAVNDFRKKIAEADAVLFATPEYNYTISSVLKNAIEWGSRPSGEGVLNEKPIAIMGASTGNIGTARAQHDLRKIAVQVNMYPVNKPQVIITQARGRFDEHGNITDEKTVERIQKLIETLVQWAKKLN